MDSLMQWGVVVILALQGVHGYTGVMKFYSLFGTEEFFLLVLPVLYWCVDASLGLRLAVVLVGSSSLNALLKVAFHLPRPYWYDARVQALSVEPSYGLPSGHAMNSTTLWGFLALQLKKWWTWAAALALIFLVSLSRLYLGVHFPTDVHAGWLFGALILVAFTLGERPAIAWLRRLTFGQQLGLAFAISLVYIALFGGTLAAIAGSPDPAQWEQTAARAAPPAPGQTATQPRNPDDAMTSGGMILGLGAALACNARRPKFDARGPWLKRLARFAAGTVGVLVFWLGLKFITPAEPYLVEAIVRYVRYGLALFWALSLAPMLFVRLRLAEPY
jgi:membrane-associated phospholipid phosphatase